MPKKARKKTAVPGIGSIAPGEATKLNEAGERLFARIAEEVMHGERALFDDLSTHERQLVLEWLADSVAEGTAETAIHDVLWEVDTHEKPVRIEQFLDDDFYLGRATENLHPKWREDLVQIFSPRSQIFEWVLTGAIGIGKTTLACIAQAYKIYCLSCLKSPARYYGLMGDAPVLFGVYSATKTQAGDSSFFKLRSFLDSSGYFRTKFPRDRKIDAKIRFKKSLIQVVPGSQELHALGLDLFGFSIDEANFMATKEDKTTGKDVGQAYDLYNATSTRILTRFMRPGGIIPGLMCLMSSRNVQTSFLENHLKKIDPRHTYVSDYPIWEVKPPENYVKPKFIVEIGDRLSQSRVLKPGEKPRKTARTIEIPGEYRKRFEEDVDQSLRDVAGVATFNKSPLIRDRQSVFDAQQSLMSHPFSREVVTVDIDDDVRIDEYFEINKICRVQNSRWVPRLNPNVPRFAHVDIGLSNDCLGLAMGHVAGMTRCERTNTDGTVSTITQPHIVIDLMLRVAAVPGSEVDLSKIRSFFEYLSTLFNLLKITFDQFQSADSIQILKKLGFEAGHQSVDRTEEAYLMLRSAFFDRRIYTYEYEPFVDEVLDLERVIDNRKRKVDHPLKSSKGGKGSKDVSDAVAGVTWLCMKDERARVDTRIVDLERPTDAPPDLAAERAALLGAKASEGVAGMDVSWSDLERNLAGHT